MQSRERVIKSQDKVVGCRAWGGVRREAGQRAVRRYNETGATACESAGKRAEREPRKGGGSTNKRGTKAVSGDTGRGGERIDG